MNIDLMITMANQIGSFFSTESLDGKAPADVALHLRRYWNPHMRKEIIAYYHARQGSGLEEVALQAVALLAQEAKAKEAAAVASAGPAAAGSMDPGAMPEPRARP